MPISARRFSLANRLFAAGLIIACASTPVGAQSTHPNLLPHVAGKPIGTAEIEIADWLIEGSDPRETIRDGRAAIVVQKQLALAARAAKTLTASELTDIVAARLRSMSPQSSRAVLTRLSLLEHYERLHAMLRASHLLLEIDDNASNDEIDATIKRAMDIHRSIIAGATTFADAVRRYSQDLSTRDEDGDLGYFTVFELPYPLETVAFGLEPGELSLPIKTQFGIHLVQLTERIRLIGLKRVAHIMIAAHGEDAKHRINELQQLAAHSDFAAIAERYSEDHRTRHLGGDLGTTRLLDELESVRLRLGAGEVSRPIRSASGWHLLKVTEITAFAPLDALYTEIREKMQLQNRLQQLTAALASIDRRYPEVDALLAFYEDFELARSYLARNTALELPIDFVEWLIVIQDHSTLLDQLELDALFPVTYEAVEPRQ